MSRRKGGGPEGRWDTAGGEQEGLGQGGGGAGGRGGRAGV